MSANDKDGTAASFTADQAERSRLKRVAEYRKGGKLSPCPCCGTPRFQMSDFIRCHVCSLNWVPGEDLNRNLRIERYEKMVAQGTGKTTGGKR